MGGVRTSSEYPLFRSSRLSIASFFRHLAALQILDCKESFLGSGWKKEWNCMEAMEFHMASRFFSVRWEELIVTKTNRLEPELCKGTMDV